MKAFFDNDAKTKTGNKISNGTAVSYFNKVRAVINAAHAKGVINRNPLAQVSGIKAEKTERVYLEMDEVRELVKTACRYDVLKRAFLFSCLTGLRWSDVNKLEWSEISRFNGTARITFNQKKTRALQYLDISEQALSLLGQRADDGKVFMGLKFRPI